MKITKKTSLAEIVTTYPTTIRIFEKYKLACRCCHFARKETLEHAAKSKHMPLAKIRMELQAVIENISSSQKK